MFSTTTKTALKLADMFTENTGRSLLDSGDAYGRAWERNQGKLAADFLDAPAAYWAKDYGATLDLFHFLNNRLIYTETSAALTEQLHEYCGDDLYSCTTHEDWAKENTGPIPNRTEPNTWNSYNWDNLLNGTIQGVDFTYNGDDYVILQVHGGCDVRGGYTAPVVFETRGQYWLHDCESVILVCTNAECEVVVDVRGPDQYENSTDSYLQEDLTKGCPTCGSDFRAIAEEPMEW
jgi:hypothetical protein